MTVRYLYFVKKPIQLILLLTLALFIGCQKNNQITYQFDGVVVSDGGGITVEGAEVEIRQKIIGAVSSSLNYSLAATGTTSATGVYRIIIEREMVAEFKYVISKEGYFSQEVFESSQFVDVGKPNIRNYALEPKGYVKFDIENVGTVNPDDEYVIFGFNFKEGCSECFSNGYNYFLDDVDTTFVVATSAQRYVRFFHQNLLEGMPVNDSVFVPLNDTTEYNITF